VLRQKCVGGEWNGNHEANSEFFDVPVVAQSESITTFSIAPGTHLTKTAMKCVVFLLKRKNIVQADHSARHHHLQK
jgi:hypothetical protein